MGSQEGKAAMKSVSMAAGLALLACAAAHSQPGHSQPGHSQPGQPQPSQPQPAPAALQKSGVFPGAPPGYLNGQGPDTLKILPPAPTPGTTRYEADRTIFLQTRSMKDSPRWKLAAADNDQMAIVTDMTCAIGAEVTEANAPKTMTLIKRVGADMRPSVDRPKDFYKRQRPYLIDEGPICVDKTPALAASADYPSGHNTWGWTVGLVMAELVPDRATEILVRARAYGESRLVCGVHNLSAVEAGRLNASIVVAGLHGAEAFRKDMDAARKELAALRKNAPVPDATACAAEADLIAKSPY